MNNNTTRKVWLMHDNDKDWFSLPTKETIATRERISILGRIRQQLRLFLSASDCAKHGIFTWQQRVLLLTIKAYTFPNIEKLFSLSRVCVYEWTRKYEFRLMRNGMQ